MALAVAFLGLTACVERSPEAPSDGPSGPKPVETEFELVASIPGLGASSPLFHRIMGVKLGPTSDHVYVLDQFRNSVRVFDFEGDLLREFGGEGEGAGQIIRAGGLRVVGNSLHVRDGALSRITWFDWDGTYLGSRTSAAFHLDPDAQGSRRSHAEAMMRHDQMLAYDGSGPGRGTYLLLDAGDVLIDTVFTSRGGGTYVRTRARPERWSHVPQIPSSGVQGYLAPIADSLVFTADLRNGTVRWYRFDRGTVSLVKHRDIGLSLRQVSFTEAEARAQAAEALNLPPDEILELDAPDFEARLLPSGFGDPTTGDVWVTRRHENDSPADAVGARWVLVPFDESAPVLELELPRSFHLRATVDDLLLGVHVDPDTEVESVRIYRWRLRDHGLP